jgi:hypothetical protein
MILSSPYINLRPYLQTDCLLVDDGVICFPINPATPDSPFSLPPGSSLQNHPSSYSQLSHPILAYGLLKYVLDTTDPETILKIVSPAPK